MHLPVDEADAIREVRLHIRRRLGAVLNGASVIVQVGRVTEEVGDVLGCIQYMAEGSGRAVRAVGISNHIAGHTIHAAPCAKAPFSPHRSAVTQCARALARSCARDPERPQSARVGRGDPVAQKEEAVKDLAPPAVLQEVSVR